MRRRKVLGTIAGATLGGVAGCAGLFETRSALAPPLVENRPNAVYYPTHVEGMKMAGMQSQGSYKCALTYTYPHRFWLVTASRREKVEIKATDSVHLMPVVWDTKTGIVPPDINPQISVTQDGEKVAQLGPWPMLSQPMGFHFGDNVQLGGNGTYTVEVSIGSPSTRRTGSLADNQGQASFTFEFDFQQSKLEEIRYRDIPADKQGTKGAVPPMEMKMMPNTQVPPKGDLPGTVRGLATSGDAQFVITTLSDATRFGGNDDETYLAVSPRTPYNRYMLPLMSLSATLKRGSETIYDGILQSTIDPELRYHYGAAVSGVESGDELTITVDAPPQTARHEGYEMAFLEMNEMSVTL
ncbi:MAG: iron transporter [Halobacteriaceae archaeon]